MARLILFGGVVLASLALILGAIAAGAYLGQQIANLVS